MKELEENKIKVLFSQSRDYRKISATGVWGGPTPSGEILCNFFIESLGYPDELEITISSLGKKELERPIFKDDKEGRTFVREMQIGILLNPLVAKSIGEWLSKKAEEMIQKVKDH
jgi:hypothetical protein